MDELCFLEMESSYLRNRTVRLALVHQPRKDSVVKPLEEPILAQDQGERIWHEEDQQCLTLP